eukprot:bmy_20750T0
MKILVLVLNHAEERKSICKVMEEQGVMEKFLKKHPKVDPAAKCHFNNNAVAYEPFTSYLDVSELGDRVAMYVHAYTLYSAFRPFGCSFMLGSYSVNDGAQLYMIDPLGVSYGYWACAIGKARQAAKTEIEKLQMKEMTCHDVVKEVAKIIYIVHDEVKDKAFELELSWVGEITNGRHETVPKDIREEAEKYAKESLKEEDESDDDNM